MGPTNATRPTAPNRASRVPPALLAALLLAGCEDAADVAAPTPDIKQPTIVDAAHLSSVGHFYFLPPMVAEPETDGTFDGSLSPEVVICALDGSICGATVVTYTTTTGAGSERIRIDADEEHYIVNWHTDRYDIDAETHYRIRVLAEGVELGYADIDVVSSGQELSSVDAAFVGIKHGRTLPIKFRIEEGALDAFGIVFNSGRDGNDELYVMGVDGSGETRLTDTTTYEGEPAWSPDGTRIAFQSDRAGTIDLYTMNADGSGVTAVTSDSAEDRRAAWAPDGTRLAFESDRDSAGVFEIYAIGSDGAGLVRLTDADGQSLMPDWSPDGAKIVFVSTRTGNDELFVMNADGSDPVRLTTTPGAEARPTWSPDGTKIAFERDGGIFVIDADGSGESELTTGFAAAHPSWSPDGTRIAFASERDGAGNVDVYTIRLDGTGITRLTDASGADREPAWRRR